MKRGSMLGFEHPSHMVTHPSTDEAQCCLTLGQNDLFGKGAIRCSSFAVAVLVVAWLLSYCLHKTACKLSGPAY